VFCLFFSYPVRCRSDSDRLTILGSTLFCGQVRLSQSRCCRDTTSLLVFIALPLPQVWQREGIREIPASPLHGQTHSSGKGLGSGVAKWSGFTAMYV